MPMYAVHVERLLDYTPNNPATLIGSQKNAAERFSTVNNGNSTKSRNESQLMIRCINIHWMNKR